jgi:vacuolar iron transporter family protein
MEHEHSVTAIRERLSASPHQSYLRDWIYGGIDGAVTTFAVVSGVVGAQLSLRVILVIGAANLLADGVSMAASNFLGTRAEAEELKHAEAIEQRHIDLAPEGEREEVRQIFAEKGFRGDDLRRVVELITADRNIWIQTMLTEEYGLPKQVRSPWKAALSTFSAFLLCGLPPVVPFVFDLPRPLELAAISTSVVFFAIGSMKSKWSPTSWWRSGIETLTVGAIAAMLAYFVGVVLRGLTG